MAINLLFDTCSLRQLISPVEFNVYLKQLLTWHEQELITVFCSRTLLSEWQKHREEELSNIKKVLKNHQQVMKASKLFKKAPDIADARLTAADKLLCSQIEAVDDLLKKCHQIQDEDSAVVKMWSHKSNCKAPFHKKNKSDNDAVILFSTLDDIVNNGGDELYFISANHTDYTAPGDLSNIHPDISEAYVGIKIKYYTAPSDMVKALTSLGLPSSNNTSITKQKLVPRLIPIDTEKPIILQLYSYLEKRFDDINFLPKKLFGIHFPLIVAESYVPKERPFTLITDNQELYHVFVDLQDIESLTLDSDTLPFSETDSVLRRSLFVLQNNMVKWISFKDGRAIKLPSIISPDCHCEICLYRTFDFKGVLDMLSAVDFIEKPSLNKAFAYYLFGKFTQAVEILKLVAEQAKRDLKWLIYYIASYNLYLLGKLLTFGIDGSERSEGLITELRSISLKDVFEISKTESLNEILTYLKDGDFMSEALKQASKLVTIIKDDQIDKNAGWTDHVRTLLDLYFETVYFVEQNFIMLDMFSDLAQLTSVVTDGLFASYASRKNLGGKLLHFSDAIVEKIVSYGRAEDIVKFRNRYDIKIAKFKSENGRRSFVRQFLHLIDSYSPVVDYFNKLGSERNGSFWQKYRRMLLTSLALAGMLELDKKNIAAISEKLLRCLKVERHFHEYELSKFLSYFVRNNIDLLEADHLEGYLLYSFTSGKDLLDLKLTLSNGMRNRTLELNVSDEQWVKLQSSYLVNRELSERLDKIDDICLLYETLSDENKKTEIAKFLSYNLKTAFNGQLYYTSVMHNIIRPKKRMTELYEAEIMNVAQKGRNVRLLDPGFYTDHRIDEYINFNFRYKRLFNAVLVTHLQELGEYYVWITDIDSFDYERFDSDWLFVHLSKYYMDMFKKSQALKFWMRNQIFRSNDQRLSKLFIKLYSPKRDEKKK